MTEEEAINRCKELIKETHSSWIGISNQTAIETVLNSLQQKDERTSELEKVLIDEQLKHSSELDKKDREKEKYINLLATQDIENIKEIEKKDRKIDLMANFMYKTGTGRRAFSCEFKQNNECNQNGCVFCIKKYFKSKVGE